MAKEQEVKLAAADASVLRAVLRDPRLAGRVEVFQMDTTYYDLATIEKFQTLCSAHFTRTAVTLLRPDATVELDCDRGVLIGGCKTTPICEVELELKAGNPVALTPLRVYLTVNYNMHEEMRSKFARALALKRES